MNKKKIIILGMGGHGRVCESIIKDYQLFRWLGYVDDVRPEECLGSSQDLLKLQKKHGNFGVFVAIGNNTAREKVMRKVKAVGITFVSIVHPTAAISANVKIGDNVFVGANVVINNASVIGNGVYINSGSIVEHDNEVGEFSHLAPGVVTGGVVKIGKRCFVGMGSVIN